LVNPFYYSIKIIVITTTFHKGKNQDIR